MHGLVFLTLASADCRSISGHPMQFCETAVALVDAVFVVLHLCWLAMPFVCRLLTQLAFGCHACALQRFLTELATMSDDKTASLNMDASAKVCTAVVLSVWNNTSSFACAACAE